ncbi:MAG TPA: ATP-binding protein [Anaerolineales bacterium]
MQIDRATLSSLHSLRAAARLSSDWKGAFDNLLAVMRPDFMFDNVALYVLDSRRRNLEVAYARAAGRGRSSEADASWGETIAGEVLAGNHTIERLPSASPNADRIQRAYVLGLPIVVAGRTEGALVFVRFGGPEYSDLHRALAEWIADTAGSLLESRGLLAARSELETAQRQMRLQDDFVSTISHELRTPLGFIKGYTTSLLREDTIWDEKTRREFLSIIEEEADRLRTLLENMLESARLQSQTAKFRVQPVQMDALVQDVVTRVRLRHPQLEIHAELAEVPPISGDAPRLVQVLENLFGNAIKYAPGSPLFVRLRRDDRRVSFSLEDHGPGIPEEYMPFVFERFYRGDADVSATGTGLGLYICRQIVLGHHGKIWVESLPEQGATFFIELPLPAA